MASAQLPILTGFWLKKARFLKKNLASEEGDEKLIIAFIKTVSFFSKRPNLASKPIYFTLDKLILFSYF